MKILSFIALSILFAVADTTPSATVQLTSGKSTYIRLRDAGSNGYVFQSSIGKQEHFISIDSDFKEAFRTTVDKSRNVNFLKSNEAFFIINKQEKKKDLFLEIIKGNSKGLIGKYNLTLPHTSLLDLYTIDIYDDKIIALIKHKKSMEAIFINKSDLKRVSSKILNLPDVGDAELDYEGIHDNLFRFSGYVKPNDELGIKNPALYLALINFDGKLVEEKIVELPDLKNKAFVPSYYYKLGDTRIIGPLFESLQSPYSSDLILYTFYIDRNSNSLAWKRKGIYMVKLRQDNEKFNVVYEADIPMLTGDDVANYFRPVVKVWEDDYICVIYREKSGGRISGKFFMTTAILNPKGELMVHEKSPDDNHGYSSSSEDLSEFLQFSKKIKSVKEFSQIPEIIQKSQDKKFDGSWSLVRKQNEWVLIKVDKNNNTVDFYKL